MQTRVLPKTQVESLLKGGYQRRSIRAAVDRVNRGMARLDSRSPDWQEKMKLNNLDMSDSAFCVLGQAFRSYDTGLDKVGIVSEKESERHGFLVASRYDRRWDYGNRTYDLLDVVWTHAISARNSAGRKVFLRMPA